MYAAAELASCAVPSIQLWTFTEQNSDRVRLTSLDQLPLLDIRRSIQLRATNSVDVNGPLLWA
jgi:hypothetical protein